MRQYLLKKQLNSPEFVELTNQLQSTALAAVYFAKGIKTQEQLQEFSSYSNLLPVDELYDLDGFLKRVLEHQEKNSKIVVYGDYDADGAVAASILWRFLSKVLKLTATVYIPDRHEEGYGLNRTALETLATQGVDLLITVDCGVRDAVLIKEITEKTHMEIIVTDHHQAGESFPACVTVHPMYPGHESTNKYISGGVVVWKICRYLEEKLKLSHDFTESVVDLAGTSLVTDIMPLKDENRVILRKALRKLRTQPSLGLRVLMENAQVKQEDISAYHLGYVIGPRLNASGRIGDQYASTRLLSTDNESVARKLAGEIANINSKRQEITKNIYALADQAKIIIADKLLITAGENWDDGVVGLVAGKLMNRYNLPTIVVTMDPHKKLAKGSARSFGELNITELFEKIAYVFSRYGGHHNAAGFTLRQPNAEQLISEISTIITKEYNEYMPTLIRFIAAYVLPSELTENFFVKLQVLEPFGQENPEPLFAVKGKVAQFSTFGQQGNHLRILLQTEGGEIKALAFDRVELLTRVEQGQELVLVGRPRQDEYQGKKQISFFIEEIVEGNLKEID
ncbi:single-stranded-DNA-specific exonuclease RecJ [bacterium]|nr:single-stranded-DNA-specific exonuclease RecJ [bacterium]